MGELGITINDIDKCKGCGSYHSLMFQTPKEEWWIACGKCGKKTGEHPEVFDAACEWGLRSAA
jgi:hypothetical protein